MVERLAAIKALKCWDIEIIFPDISMSRTIYCFSTKTVPELVGWRWLWYNDGCCGGKLPWWNDGDSGRR